MNEMQKLPIGIQDFESLRREDYFYADKTELIYRMVSQNRYYFLSRPRRFGKSLLMSTIHALYDGKKELFDGTIGKRLAIADKADIKWEAHPVLHLDLNTQKYDSIESLENVLNETLTGWEELYGKNPVEIGFGRRFQGVIKRAYEKTKLGVVILVDEYDKPMLQAIGKEELLQEFRDTLKGFYGALKSMDGCIKFALLTGVTKFGKVSVFSDLNNLMDISIDARYWDVCGLTEQEIHSSFPNEIDALAKANDITNEECVEQLKLRYDGYHFVESVPGIYNPFSVLNTLAKGKFGSYWFETGTPTYLVELLQKFNTNLEEMANSVTTEDIINCVDINSASAIPVIYQSGYLTIKDYDKEFGSYTLGFPNMEVKEGFIKFLLPFYTSVTEDKSTFNIQQFVKDVRAGNTDAFVKRLRSLFADTPYEIVKDIENHYQNVIWIVSKLMGFYTQAEYHTSEGRIDLVIKTPQFCYVIEFKLDGTAEEALQQISDKQYTLPFELDNQQIIRIGMNFSSETRNIERYLIG